MSNRFCPSRRCLCSMMALRGLSQQSNNRCVRTAFSFDMLYKNYCWAAVPDPIWTINVPYERIMNMLSCVDISFVISLFNFEKFWVKPRFPFMQLNRANTQNLEKVNFDMFYKNYCWAVICYSICVTNVSYEREMILLSFPVISFVILIFLFQRFDIKSGFPFYWLTLYTVYLSLISSEILLKQKTKEVKFLVYFILYPFYINYNLFQYSSKE